MSREEELLDQLADTWENYINMKIEIELIKEKTDQIEEKLSNQSLKDTMSKIKSELKSFVEEYERQLETVLLNFKSELDDL